MQNISEVDFDIELFEKLNRDYYRSRFFKSYRLLDENIEEYLSSYPFVIKRVSVSYAFIEDCIIGLKKLLSFIKAKNIQTYNDLVKQVPQYNFYCRNAEEFEAKLINHSVPKIFCNIVFKEIPEKHNTFGVTYDLDDKIVVSINEFNETSSFGSWGILAGLSNKQIQDRRAEDYVEAMIKRIQSDYFHNHKYIHEFQHVMQMLHNRCSLEKYDLEADASIADTDDMEAYYNCTSEKEAFLISYIFGMQQMGTDFSSHDEVSENCKKLMKSDRIPENYFWIFDRVLKKLYKFDESVDLSTNTEILTIMDKLGIKDKDAVLKRAQEILSMTKEEKQQAWNEFLKRGFC